MWPAEQILPEMSSALSRSPNDICKSNSGAKNTAFELNDIKAKNARQKKTAGDPSVREWMHLPSLSGELKINCGGES
jgi:hypothetical protein